MNPVEQRLVLALTAIRLRAGHADASLAADVRTIAADALQNLKLTAPNVSVIYVDGKPLLEIEITTIQPLDPLDRG